MVSQIKVQRATTDNAQDVLNGLSRDVVTIVTEINNSPLTNARKLVTASLTTTPQPIAHNLGYSYQGVLVVKKTASLDVYDGESTSFPNPDFTRYAMLRVASGSGTVTLLFF